MGISDVLIPNDAGEQIKRWLRTTGTGGQHCRRPKTLEKHFDDDKLVLVLLLFRSKAAAAAATDHE